MKIDTKKGVEVFNSFLQKTSDAGKRAVSEVQKGAEKVGEAGKRAAADVQSGAVALAEKARQDNWERRMKKYNPLFPDEYNSEAFCVPNMIVIVDDAVRRGIDVCEGAIGWRSMQSGVEVLHLYDEAIKESGIRFVPAVTCDAVYYVDSFDRNRYIRTDCIFNKAHEERLAELKNVAHALGAKRCTIEIIEATQQVNVQNKKTAASGGVTVKGQKLSAGENVEQSSSVSSSNQRAGRIVAEFEGSSTPHRPKLKWFAHDDNIKKLIDMRCKGDNTVKSEMIELSGSSSATMSQKTACAIDGAIGKIGGMKGSTTMESQAIMESSTKMVYSVEF